MASDSTEETQRLFDKVIIVNVGLIKTELCPYIAYKYPKEVNELDNLPTDSKTLDEATTVVCKAEIDQTGPEDALENVEKRNSRKVRIAGQIHTINEEVDPFLSSIMKFCFPDIDSIQPSCEMKRNTFLFVMTNSDGGRRFGYCLRTLPSGSGLRFPYCICVVSYMPCYDLFSQLLLTVEAKYNANPSLVDDLLGWIYNSPVPLPGASLEFNCLATKEGMPLEKHKFTRPADVCRFLDMMSFTTVLKTIRESALLSLFSSILMERRIIFVASDISVLSNTVQTLVSILYPFHWVHIYVPVLPPSLFDFCCAPMPFILGVLKESLETLYTYKSSMEEVILFDIDAGSFIWKPYNDIDNLPRQNVQAMLKALKDVNPFSSFLFKNKKQLKPSDLNAKISDIFLGFFVDMFSRYTFYLVGVASGEKFAFNSSSFIASVAEEKRKFLTMFTQTQMYDNFISDRERNKDRYNGEFERKVQMLIRFQDAQATANPHEQKLLEEAINKLTHKPNPGLVDKFLNSLRSAKDT